MMMHPFTNKRLIRELAAVAVLAAALVVVQPAQADSKDTSASSRALLLEAVTIAGNVHVSDETILGAMQLGPGDTLSVEILERERIRMLGAHYLIASVDFSTRPGSRRGTVVLDIEIGERKTVSFETGYGYHDIYGWFLTLLGARFDHAFGIDSRLKLGLRFGFHLSGLDAEWVKPPPPEGGPGFGARFYIYGEEHHFFGNGGIDAAGGGGGDGPFTWDGAAWREFRQKIGRAGTELSLRYRIGGSTRFSFGVAAESVDPDSSFTDVEEDRSRGFEDLPGLLQPEVGKTVITGLFFRTIRDTRSRPGYPVSGSYVNLSMHANNTILGGDEVFTKLTFDYRKHIHLGGARVLSSRVNAGIVSRGAPYFERFWIGGIYSIRGFQELSLSRTTGDDGFWMISEELRFPLVHSDEGPPRLSGLLFFDAGQGWRRGSPFSTSGVESAAGYGVRLRLPWLGTLGFDIGIPFSEGRTGDSFRFHGALGFSF
jgi:outer membrane protein insertion porin family